LGNPIVIVIEKNRKIRFVREKKFYIVWAKPDVRTQKLSDFGFGFGWETQNQKIQTQKSKNQKGSSKICTVVLYGSCTIRRS
jgi:hypothetical protein